MAVNSNPGVKLTACRWDRLCAQTVAKPMEVDEDEDEDEDAVTGEDEGEEEGESGDGEDGAYGKRKRL